VSAGCVYARLQSGWSGGAGVQGTLSNWPQLVADW